MWSSLAESMGVAPRDRGRADLLDVDGAGARCCSCSTTSSSCPARTTSWPSCSTRAPHVVVVATSRRPLGHPAERRVPVSPLALPDDVTLGCGARLQRRTALRAAGRQRAAPLRADTGERRGRRRGLPAPGRPADGHRAVCRPDPRARPARPAAAARPGPRLRLHQPARRRSGSGRCARPSGGPTSCSPRRSAGSSAAWACSPVGETSTRSPRSPPTGTTYPCRRTRSTRSPSWSTPAWPTSPRARTASRGSRCSRRCAPSPRTSSGPPGRWTPCVAGTPSTTSGSPSGCGTCARRGT